ncbi:MAG TPA: FlgD immunoglobulin-like domain containing protein [Gemmatimonadaceae bacterium]|jgi:DNA-binding beta-propeller fold protein YncE|nr:FlgD immunoglobulin-like domain containing protein [Gemmatimonadaceae bacterium]
MLRALLLALLPASLLGASSAAATQTQAYVLTTDFSTGSCSAVNLDTRVVSKDVTGVWNDAVVRWYDHKIYVVNRAGQDNIQVVDPAASFATVLQFSTGPGSNPQDIAFYSPSKAYVSLYDRQALLVCNPATGATLDTISLAQFADADHLPEMAHLALVGSHLFVAIQRLDRLSGYVPTGPGLVAVIDCEADTVLDVDPVTPGVQAITLVTKNPVTTFSYIPDSGRLLIGCAGKFLVNDGGIEAIDVHTLQSLGLISTEAQLGGDIGDIEWWSPTHSYAIVSDASYNSSLVSFDPSTGAKIATVRSPGGFSLPDCAIDDRGELYVADNGYTTAGLYVYRAGTDALLAGPLDTGLPPNQITFDEERSEVAGAPDGGAPPARLEFAAPAPNPARGDVTLDLRLPEAGPARIEVLDVAGRRVATIADGPRPAGEWRLTWRALGAGGTPLPSGVYQVRARVGALERVRRIAIVR